MRVLHYRLVDLQWMFGQVLAVVSQHRAVTCLSTSIVHFLTVLLQCDVHWPVGPHWVLDSSWECFTTDLLIYIRCMGRSWQWCLNTVQWPVYRQVLCISWQCFCNVMCTDLLVHTGCWEGLDSASLPCTDRQLSWLTGLGRSNQGQPEKTEIAKWFSHFSRRVFRIRMRRLTKIIGYLWCEGCPMWSRNGLIACQHLINNKKANVTNSNLAAYPSIFLLLRLEFSLSLQKTFAKRKF
jgi:hypothetical protein